MLLYPRVTEEEDISILVVRIETDLERELLTLSGLHDKRKARVDAIGGLLALLCWCHRCVWDKILD